jgi:hypothetical protein
VAAGCRPDADVAPLAPRAGTVAAPRDYRGAAAQIIAVADRECTIVRSSTIGSLASTQTEVATSTVGLVARTATVVRFAVAAGPVEIVVDADAAGWHVVRSAPLSLDGVEAVAEGSCLGLEAVAEGSAGALALGASIDVTLCPDAGLSAASVVHRYADTNGEVALLTVAVDCETPSTAENP